MKAVVYTQYGGTDVLRLEEVEKPVPKGHEVLIKIHAVSLNASDWELLRGKPYYTRIWGLTKPKYKILGSDIAGIVESVGIKVKQFKPGDAVFGDLLESWGGLAEFVCASEEKIMHKPDFISFKEVAALPQAAVVALQGLNFNGQLKQGYNVMIIGAGGGAGSFAIQIAKLYGARVTAVDSGKKLEMMRTLGADQVIDYAQEEYTRKNGYDLILDLVGKKPVLAFKRMLNINGGYAMVGGSVNSILQSLLLGSFITKTGKRKMGLLIHNQNKKDLNYLLKLFEAGKLKTVIDKEFPLSQAAEALKYLGEGHAKGKVVITVCN